ncbi:MAG: phosphonopyruvate decarboxylase [Spirochaetaceae bacterium]|jgi:phosphonopyruvate decarboxylase|nr:phosphonopyruvate decarboxylase [Spirochaetaceae bacterium]
MIGAGFFYDELRRRGVDFFTGVPDSLLKDFCAYISANAPPLAHVTAANEGAALALASGYHLAANKTALVYMQNSGIGNAVNPLLSLCDKDVYRIPALLLIGWRGESGVHDEPQHITQGRLTLPLLETLEVPCLVMKGEEAALSAELDEAFSALKRRGVPFALVARKGTFSPYKGAAPADGLNSMISKTLVMSREEAVEEIILSSPDDFFFCTTGMASRELYELREKHGLGRERDFLTVGSMGHASSLALGAASARPDALITCIDGDGAVLMHMGSLAIAGTRKPRGFRHIVLNNGAHDSVGGQLTAAFNIDLAGVARACGYEQTFCVNKREELRFALGAARNGPIFIEARVKKGSRQDLGRPKSSPVENKTAFMKLLCGM